MGKTTDIRIGPGLSLALARLRPHEAPLLSLALAYATVIDAKASACIRTSLAAIQSSSPGVDLSPNMPLTGSRLGTGALTLEQVRLPVGDEKGIARAKSEHNFATWAFGGLYSRFSSSRTIKRRDTWSASNFLAMAKTFFTHGDRPRAGVLFASATLAGWLHAIDWSAHREVDIRPLTDQPTGLTLTRAHTLYGDIDIVYDPTLDRWNMGTSGGLIDIDRLVRYVTPPERRGDCIEIRECIDLDGSCHIWIDGRAPGDNSITIGIPKGDAYDGDDWD